jgi:DNA-binding MarR family transcriptional regulator
MATTDDLQSPFDRLALARLTLDANGDGQLTTADLAAHAHDLFFLPGDSLIFWLVTYVPPVARLLGVGTADYGGVAAGFFSACAWFIVFMIGSIAYHFVLDVDRRVTSATRQLYSSVVLRIRIARALLRQRCRALLAALKRERRTVVVPEVQLSQGQLRVLQLHSTLPPGYSFTVSEVARAIGARNATTQQLLTALTDLGLLCRALGGSDDETSYSLTAAGKALLTFQSTGGRAPARTGGRAPAPTGG